MKHVTIISMLVWHKANDDDQDLGYEAELI